MTGTHCIPSDQPLPAPSALSSVDRALTLNQAVMHLDWRVCILEQELQLSEGQLSRVRMIIANAMAKSLARRQTHCDGESVRQQVRPLLTADQRERLDRMSRGTSDRATSDYRYSGNS